MNFATDHCIGLLLKLPRTLPIGSAAMLTTTLICLVSLTTIATAQDSGDKPVDEMKIAIKAAELQQQLVDPSIETRDAAEAELIKLGVIALDYLDPVTDDSPPDAIERLGRIRKALETIVVEAAAKPTQITLKGNFSVKEATEKIAKQSGNKIVLAEELQAQEQKFDLQIENATFWEAMKIFEAQTKLRANTFGGDAGELLLAPATNAVTVPTDSSGVFQASVLQVSARRNLENPELDYCGLRIRVRWEPRLAPITLAIPASSVSVIDEFGDKVTLPNLSLIHI